MLQGGASLQGAKPSGWSARPAVDLGRPAAVRQIEVGLEPDDRIASAHRAALDRFQQEAHRPRRRRSSETPTPGFRDRRPAWSRRPAPRRARSAWQTPLLAARSAWRTSICAVAGSAADHLVQRALIDASRRPRSASRAIYSLSRSSERPRLSVSTVRLTSSEAHVEGGRHDIGDAEHDLLAGLARFGACRLRPWRCGTPHRWRPPKAAPDASPRLRPVKVSTLRWSAVATSARVPPALSLSTISVALVLSRVAISCVAPARLDLLLDFVERAFPRGRYSHDVKPDVAVLELERIALDTDVGGKRQRQQALRIGKVDRHAGGIAAGAVDRFDRYAPPA